jgi:hypothetical protein
MRSTSLRVQPSGLNSFTAVLAAAAGSAEFSSSDCMTVEMKLSTALLPMSNRMV